MCIRDRLQEQHHEQRRQSKVQARSVKGEETPQQAAQCCARNPVEVVQQGDPEVEIPPGHAFRRLQSGHQGKRLVAQHVDQKRPNLSQALVFVQQAQPVEHVPGIDHDGQQKRLHGVKSRSQQRDGHKLHTAAESDGAHEDGPSRPIPLGPVSYTHLDVYKRQGTHPADLTVYDGTAVSEAAYRCKESFETGKMLPIR